MGRGVGKGACFDILSFWSTEKPGFFNLYTILHYCAVVHYCSFDMFPDYTVYASIQCEIT